MSSVNFTGQNVAEFIITGFDHLPYQKLLGFLILLTYILVLLSNSTNICIIVTDRRLHRPMYLLICNLAVVDMIFTTSACTTMISVLLTEVKSISYYSCISHMYIYHLGDSTVCLALPIMALDRIIAISCPLRYSTILTNLRTIALIFITWVIGCSAVGPFTSWIDSLPYCQPVIRYVFCDSPAMVMAACADPEPYFVICTIISVLFLSTFFLILLSYMKIIYTVLRLSNNKGRAQLFNTCISHLIVVLSYYAPKFVYVLLTRIGLKLNLTEHNAIVIVSTLLPPLINPTVYCLRTKEIRMRLVQILLLPKNNTTKRITDGL